MRNLKKILALVLALMMTVSLMVVASAASIEDYEDADSVSDQYVEAVDVLTGMGLFKGDENGFRPQDPINRAEVSTIIYRMMSKDTDDSDVGAYAGYADESFTDLDTLGWNADGYIGYSTNLKYVIGNGDGTFNPTGNITGYELLTILMRLVGYDENDEFAENWPINVMKVVDELGLLAAGYIDNLNAPLTREEVAYLIFATLTQVQKVYYTPAFGYRPYPTANMGTTIGKDNFKMDQSDLESIDVWGRPGYVWSYNTGNKSTTIESEPVYSNTVAVTECDLSTALGLKDDVNMVTYTNGEDNETRNVNVNPVDRRTTLGGQGTVMEVYKVAGYDSAATGGVSNYSGYMVVYIDTYLAEVVRVVDATYDSANHLKTEAALYLKVYDGRGTSYVVEYNEDVNYTYSVGDMLLVNAVAKTGAHTTSLLSTSAVTSFNGNNYFTAYHMDILGVATSVVGTQTIIWSDKDQHTVNGETKPDAAQYNHDAAGKTANKQFVWYFDQFGNLIGSFDYVTIKSYATISSIQWINPTSTNGYAQATLVYADGTTASKIVYSIDRDGNGTVATNEVLSYTAFQGDYSTGSVSANYSYNNVAGQSYIGVHLFEVTEGANNVVTLKQIQTPVTGATVTKGQTTITGTNGPVYLDNSTQILVRTTAADGSYVYTPYTGYSAMPSLTSATVYAVNTDADAAAEYVYMYGTAATSTSEIVVYVDSLSYAEDVSRPGYAVLKDAYVNGVKTDVTIDLGWLSLMNTGYTYYMNDPDGNGIYDGSGNLVALTGMAAAKNFADSKTSAIWLDNYTLLADAIQDTTTTVNYATAGATVYNYSDNSNLGDADTDVVLVYNTTTKVVSAVIVVDAI